MLKKATSRRLPDWRVKCEKPRIAICWSELLRGPEVHIAAPTSTTFLNGKRTLSNIVPRLSSCIFFGARDASVAAKHALFARLFVPK